MITDEITARPDAEVFGRAKINGGSCVVMAAGNVTMAVSPLSALGEYVPDAAIASLANSLSSVTTLLLFMNRRPKLMKTSRQEGACL